eukprot:8411917-Pyramimonas_sp.AAC.1
MAILEADPYLTDDARAAFIPPPEPMLGLDDVDAEPYPPVQTTIPSPHVPTRPVYRPGSTGITCGHQEGRVSRPQLVL